MVQRIQHITENGVEKKWCGKCKTYKNCKGEESRFGKGGKKCWDGLRPTCKDCLAEHNANHKEERHAYNAKYWEKTKQWQSERRKEWGEQNKDYIAAKNKEWRKINGKERDKKEWQKRKDNLHHQEYQRNYARDWCKRQRAENPTYKMKQNVSRRIREVLKEGGKSESTIKYVGCTIEQLMGHLEKQFDEYMTWQNQGHWHIDHKIPCNAFDTSNIAEATAMWHYKNLQPMWAKDNILKSDHYDEENKKQFMRDWREFVF